MLFYSIVVLVNLFELDYMVDVYIGKREVRSFVYVGAVDIGMRKQEDNT